MRDSGREGEATVTLVPLPPERRSRSVHAAAAGCCCCCCCCCLHTIGGIVGAAMGSKRTVSAPRILPGMPPPKERTEDQVKASIESARRAVPLYWFMLAAMTLATCVVTPFLNSPREAVLVTGLVVALGLPALQLAASLVAFLIILVGPFPDRGAAGEQIGMITLKAFVGGVIGAAVMGIGLLILSVANK